MNKRYTGDWEMNVEKLSSGGFCILEWYNFLLLEMNE